MFKDKRKLVKIAGGILVLSLLTSHIIYVRGETEYSGQTISNQKTLEVTQGDYVEKSTLKNLEMVYLRSDRLRIDVADATFVEMLVGNNTQVKLGDPLISYRVPADRITVEENHLKLRDTILNYENQKTDRSKAIEAMYELLDSMDGGSIDAQMQEINIRKKELEFTQFQLDSEKNIQKLETQIQEMEDKLELQFLYAPYDGMVRLDERRFGWLTEGYPIDRSWELIEIYDADSAVLSSKASNLNKLWYGLEGNITKTGGQGLSTGEVFQGKVIGADSLFNGRVTTGMIYFGVGQPEETAAVPKGDWASDLVRIQDIILVPVRSVTTSGDISYVYVAGEDGKVYKQYVTGRGNGQDMWIFNGLKAGQRIIAE